MTASASHEIDAQPGVAPNFAGRTHLSEFEAKDLVARFGVPTPKRRMVSDRPSRAAALADLAPPLAVKLVAADVLHKSDVGGVRLGVTDAESLDLAIEDIRASATQAGIEIQGFLVEEMAPPGVEVLVGGVIDPVFGPAVVVGLGGVFVEIFDDVVARICPISDDEALEMVHELRAAPLLLGARGQAPVDVAALVRILLAVGGPNGILIAHANSIREIDLNPVLVSAQGAVAVDARVIFVAEARHVA
jgi:acetyl-CoA synthetase (ADP-forming)